MRVSHCGFCGQRLYFHNVQCTRCGAILGFLTDAFVVAALQPNGAGYLPQGVAPAQSPGYRMCLNNLEHAVCNWMVREDDPEPYCAACRLNRTIPDISIGNNKALWQRLEGEKRRLVYSLMRLKLPMGGCGPDAQGALQFDFLADPGPRFAEEDRVLTGHLDGVITINIAEADDVVRERLRQEMAEPYRTILGHFRHESGHYFWDRQVRDTHWLAAFRAEFGDERVDYGEALKAHYANGPRPDWQEHFVSAYASSHPWEDWAETWAHYLHIVETMETAWQFGLRLDAQLERGEPQPSEMSFDPYDCPSFETIIEQWLPLTMALNSLNRGMGQPDAYPFVLSARAMAKLAFVHQVVGVND